MVRDIVAHAGNPDGVAVERSKKAVVNRVLAEDKNKEMLRHLQIRSEQCAGYRVGNRQPADRGAA